VGSSRVLTPQTGMPADVIDAIVGAIRASLEVAAVTEANLGGIGIGTPGHLPLRPSVSPTAITRFVGWIPRHGAQQAPGEGQAPSTFTARATTRMTTVYEIRDSTAIRPLARRVSGIVSVGLTAIAFVSDT
jgi:hypothetical protein